jgi:TatD DNase family protein
MIYDIHSHLDYYSDKKIKEVIENAKKNNVGVIIVNSINLKSLKKIFKISEKYSMVKIAAGLYPEKGISQKEYEKFEEIVLENKKKIVAIGEIGMDSTEIPDLKLQEKIFRNQLELAQKLKIPAIIHSRKQEKEVMRITKEYPKLTKIMQCFNGKLKLLDNIDKNTFFSIPTNIVRSEHFQKMANLLPKNRILTETDTPFLSPHKNIRDNEPAFIIETIKMLSLLWKIPVEEVEKQIERNYELVFK